MSYTGDWTDWAGDNPVEAEEQLRKERERNERWAEHKRIADRANIPDRDGADSAALYAKERREREHNLSCAKDTGYTAVTQPEEVCPHDNPDNDYECQDCGATIEGWEPNDTQIFAHYGQTKEVA